MPSRWLKRVERSGFAQGLFSEWRTQPGFVLDLPEHAGARILVTGANFGTGSSREHAVWGLLDHGFRAVVSPRFADIFRTNCTKAGLLPVQVDEEIGKALMAAVAADPTLVVTIDVESRTLVAPGRHRHHVPPRRLHPVALLGGTGRHRPHPAPGSGHHRLRGVPAGWMPTTR